MRQSQHGQNHSTMRIPIALFLSLLLVTSLLPLGVTAESETLVSVSPSDHTVVQGDLVYIIVFITPAEAIAGIQFDLHFNASLLQAEEVMYGGLFGSAIYFENGTINNTGGRITGVSGALTPVNGGMAAPGALASIKFTTTETIGTTPITLTNVLVGRPDATEVTITVTDGMVEVQPDLTKISVTPSKTSVSQNELFLVDIDIDPSASIAGFGADLYYDSSLVEAIDITYGDFFAAHTTQSGTAVINNTQGSVEDMWKVITAIGGGTVSEPGTFATITFQATKMDGVVDFNLSARVWNQSGQQLPFILDTESVEVTISYTELYVGTPADIVPAGNNFKVNIIVDPAEPLGGIQFDVLFNSSLLSVVDVSAGNFFDGYTYYFVPGTIDNGLGTITGIAGALTPAEPGVTSKKVFAVIEFAAAQHEGVSDINLTQVLVGDPEGFAVSTMVQDGSIEVSFTITYHLFQGWNLITMPMQHDFTSETLGQYIPNCDTITRWDTALMDYVSHPVDTAINNFAIDYGVGYFVHVTTAVDFNVSGTPIEAIDVSVAAGWSMLGWPFYDSATAELIAQQISGCDVLLMWNGALQDFVGHPVGTPVRDFTVHTGQGMFVHTTEATTWQYP